MIESQKQARSHGWGELPPKPSRCPPKNIRKTLFLYIMPLQKKFTLPHLKTWSGYGPAQSKINESSVNRPEMNETLISNNIHKHKKKI